MTAGAGPDTVFALYPEGRLFDPGARDRALSRLAERDPRRAARLSGLARVLPPRPGGFLALLEARPEADVIMIHHRGFERLSRLADLTSAVPIEQPIRVHLERFDRATIPGDPEGRTRWLDERWLELDTGLGSAPDGDVYLT